MFVILLHYRKDLTEIDTHLTAHREFLQRGYDNNYFIASGPQNPRTGGVILANLNSRETLEALLKEDPFARHKLADYEIIEFTPVKYHPYFAPFMN